VLADKVFFGMEETGVNFQHFYLTVLRGNALETQAV
jgi:hypothetical protein